MSSKIGTPTAYPTSGGFLRLTVARRKTFLPVSMTSMNKRWGENDDYFGYSPGCSIEAANHLVFDLKVKGVGFDLQALDHILYTYAAQHGPGPYVPRIVEEYKEEFGHGAGSPQAQRIMIARQGNIEGKKELAKAVAGIKK